MEYVREAGQWYLRTTLTRDDGVEYSRCEAISPR